MEEKENTAQKQMEMVPATPQKLPRLTFSPFLVAMGTSFVFWGLATSLLISLVGIGIFGVGLSIWIRELTSKNKSNET